MKKIKLDNPCVPLHYQIADYLRIMLSSGDISREEPLIPEERLKDIFGVSRTTLRHAIEHLVQEGLLERKRGKGTFWTEKAAGTSKEKLTGINKTIFNVDESVRVKVSSGKITAPADEAAEFLGLDKNSEIVYYERVRYAEGAPLSYTVNYVREEYGRFIKKHHLEKMTMLESLENIAGVRLGSIEHIVEVYRANQTVAEALKISPLDPTLRVNTRVFCRKGRPVEFVYTYFVEDRYKFRVVLD